MTQRLTVERGEGKVIFGLTCTFLNGSEQTEFVSLISDTQIRGGIVVALDMANVTAINSLGLGAVLHFYSRVLVAGSRFLMINASPRVERVFRISGIIPTCFVNKTVASLADLEV